MVFYEWLTRLTSEYEVKQLLDAVDGLIEVVFVTDETKWEEVYGRLVPVHIAGLMRQEIPLERVERQAYLGGLRERLVGMPVVRLTMSFYPSESMMRGIHAKLVNLKGEALVVSLAVSRLLLGGVRVEYGGHYKDYSLRSKLQLALEDHAQQIAGMGASEAGTYE